MKKLFFLIFYISLLMASLSGCAEKSFKSALVTDTASLEDNPFYMNVWDGFESFKKTHADSFIHMLPSESEEYYLPNFDLMADENYNIVFGVGEAMSESMMQEAIKNAAHLNSDTNYVLVDYGWKEDEYLPNLAGVEFESEASACLVGYIAGHATSTGKIGFIGGVASPAIDRFESGYKYGAYLASVELDKEITVVPEYTQTFVEPLVGQHMAEDMYADGCDVIFHAAGKTGNGVLQAANATDNWVIGADIDEYENAPKNVLTSALKSVDAVIVTLSEAVYNGENIGGQTHLFGLSQACVGIPKENPNLTEFFPGLYEKTMELQEKIIDGTITIPKGGNL